MKNYLVIGNPIEHSLSAKLHNFWIKKYNLNAIYNNKKLDENEIQKIINEIRNEKIDGINVTLPFKKAVIPFLDELTKLSEKTQSVNTIYKKNNKIIGDNTDVNGFELALKHINYNVQKKSVFILGAGGVVPSIILSLKRLEASKIFLSNRTKQKALQLKKIYPDLDIVEWGNVSDSDMIINATSLGLKDDDHIELNYDKIGKNKFFYDVIYNPSRTNFLQHGSKLGHKIENGKLMFIYQAQLSFEIWHNVLPEVNEETIKLLNA